MTGVQTCALPILVQLAIGDVYRQLTIDKITSSRRLSRRGAVVQRDRGVATSSHVVSSESSTGDSPGNFTR